MKALIAILLLACGFAVQADDYQDRSEALIRQRYAQMEQARAERDARDLAKSQSAALAFGAKHGGFKKGPESYGRDGHWSPMVSFTTADDWACQAVAGCWDEKVFMSCIDGHGNRHSLGPKGCTLPPGFGSGGVAKHHKRHKKH